MEQEVSHEQGVSSPFPYLPVRRSVRRYAYMYLFVPYALSLVPNNLSTNLCLIRGLVGSAASLMRLRTNNRHADFLFLNSAATGHHATVIQLPPGTHHVKFIVDGDMQLSNELPTAVDYTNILVNYVEVSANDIPKESSDEGKTSKDLDPPQLLPKGTEARDHAPDSVGKPQIGEGEQKTEPVFWGKVIPKYLHDVDLSEQSRRYQRAARGISDFSTPPGLPLFLGKSILNGTTLMKDDSSVLNMPNHTVLNHLATSSIKHDVLATSITTRYKRKVRSIALQHIIGTISSYYSSMLQRSYISPLESRLHHTVMIICLR